MILTPTLLSWLAGLTRRKRPAALRSFYDSSNVHSAVHHCECDPLTFANGNQNIYIVIYIFFLSLWTLLVPQWLLPLETTTTWQFPEQLLTKWLKRRFQMYAWPTTPGSWWWTAARSLFTSSLRKPMKYATSPTRRPYPQSMSSMVRFNRG